MGWDVSYHPVDTGLIRDRILPFVMGEGPGTGLDDLIARALVLAKARFRANALGLALMRRSFEGAEGIAIESQLHVWGRPFFIAADDPREVSAAIDRFVVASEAEAEAEARASVEALAPGLDPPLTASDDRPPGDAELSRGLRWKIDLFRGAYRAISEGNSTVLAEGGQEHDCRALFAGDFPLACMELVAALQPGWMARGHVWPSLLLRNAGLSTPLLTDPSAVFAPLADALPEVNQHLSQSIERNYSLGGYVPPGRVPAFRAYLEEQREAILAPVRAQPGGDANYVEVSLQKILEALHDAERREQGFVEASEIYSAPGGVMN